MSLDVYLEGRGEQPIRSGIFVREDGTLREITRDEWDQRYPNREPVVATYVEDDSETLYWANITHNLNHMANAAGLYLPLWRPDEIGVTTASQLVMPLREGLGRLRRAPDEFKKLNPENGWGDYDGLVRFVEQYLAACETHPDAIVRVSR